MMKAAGSCLLLLAFLVAWPSGVLAAGQTVGLPVNIDYGLLRSFFVNQAFTQPGERAVPVDLGNGCSRIELSQPNVGPEQSLLKLTSNIRVKLGLPLGKTCVPLSDWVGNIDVLQRLSIDQKTMRLGLETVDFRAFGTDGKRTTLDRSITELLKTYLNPFLNNVGVDLTLPVKGLQGILPLFFSSQDRPRVQSWVNTMRLGQVRVGAEAVGLDVLMDVDAPARPGSPARPGGAGSDVGNVTANWEGFDAFSVNQIASLIGQAVSEDERNTLLGTLLDARYDFVQSLSEGAPDPVLTTRQFVSSWQGLAPIMRKYLSRQSRSPLNLLTYFTVSDALVTLNKVGADAGMSVGKDGLFSLARFLGAGPAEPALDYSYAVRPDVRQFLGLGSALSESGPAYREPEIDLPPELREGRNLGRAWSWLGLGPSSAWAQGTPQASPATSPGVREWIFTRKGLEPYMGRARAALEQATTETLSKGRVEEGYHPLFRKLVLSTAWQESCWRQFIGAGEKLRTIVSYNNTSVGIMQINERVWRSLYRPESLRWSAAYNIRAGCEILELYLRRYALRYPESRAVGEDTLAQAVYAMYNGGPGQFKKFLARKKEDKLYKTDRLFFEKYSWVKNNELEKLSMCLVGR